MPGPSLDGVLPVDKPRGPTSHDVVARVRRLAGGVRTGHTGTLDPMATGVLVLCLGAATRVSRYLGSGGKEYTGEIRLGVSTDTWDAEGRTIEETDASAVDLAAARSAAARLVGALRQAPPPWSAKKIGGLRAYALARAGRPVEPALCDVVVESFEILGLAETRLSFRVACSGGTYIRSLARDLGEILRTGAHLASLRRTRNGEFDEAEAVTLDAVEAAGAEGRLADLVRPLDGLRLGLPAARLTPEGVRAAASGRRVGPPEISEWEPVIPAEGSIRLLAPEGRLVAVADVVGPSGELQPRVVLVRHRP